MVTLWRGSWIAALCVGAVGLLMSGHGLHVPGVGDLLMLAAAVVGVVIRTPPGGARRVAC